MNITLGSPFSQSPFEETYPAQHKIIDLRKKLADFRYRGVKLVYHREKGIKLAIEFNSGAGYIGGFTAFIAFWCKGTAAVRMYQRFPIQAGWTKNANAIPYVY